MTAKTSEMLAKELDAVGLTGMANAARQDYYHDFLSPLALPEMQLEADLRAARDALPESEGARRVRIEDIRLDVIDGKFDASKEESDDWAKSPEGIETFKGLIDGK